MFQVNLFVMELERVKYVLRNYLQTRIRKIQQYYLYIRETPAMKERLSPHELDFVHRYARSRNAAVSLLYHCCNAESSFDCAAISN
jgi:hypothetical protein